MRRSSAESAMRARAGAPLGGHVQVERGHLLPARVARVEHAQGRGCGHVRGGVDGDAHGRVRGRPVLPGDHGIRHRGLLPAAREGMAECRGAFQ